MNPLPHALIEKASNDHGFEYVLPSDEDDVYLASALHRAQVRIVSEESGFALTFPSAGFRLLPIELARTLPTAVVPSDRFVAVDLEALGIVLRRAAELARPCPIRRQWTSRLHSRPNWRSFLLNWFAAPRWNAWYASASASRPFAKPCSTTGVAPAR